jgi:hypothetical protein
MSYTIYVSGPIMAPGSGHVAGLPTRAEVEARKQRFEVVSNKLRAQVGSTTNVINPLDIPACTGRNNNPVCAGLENGPFGKGHTWRCYLRHDLAELVMCHEIVMLEGWEGSPGAKVEKNVAEMLGLEVSHWCEKCGRTESDGPCKEEQ